ncbi:MAG: phage integrase N-terminal SAM-like domain-containing protein, partial [Vallitaleaceae bacterium]|nr:phage integrase N-terminal SAM-like domain-containing protein [Vallitaleaceae bacterium]
MSYDSYVNAAIIEMQLRGYSPKTIDSYSKYLRRFLLFTDKPVDALSTED